MYNSKVGPDATNTHNFSRGELIFYLNSSVLFNF